MSDLYVVFLIGLVGSAHCIGMCGGFVLALSARHDRPARLHLHQLLYHLGRSITYVIFGAVAGGVGAAVGVALSGVQSLLSILLGLFLVFVGLGVMGVLRRLRGSGRLARLNVFSTALAFFLKKESPAGTLGLGLVNGLLPCGLVYALLAKAAATGSIVWGAATMAVFGLATIPALYLLGFSAFLMRPLWRARLNLVAGALVVLLGLATIVRGTPARSVLFGGGHGQTTHVESPAPGHGH